MWSTILDFPNFIKNGKSKERKMKKNEKVKDNIVAIELIKKLYDKKFLKENK